MIVSMTTLFAMTALVTTGAEGAQAQADAPLDDLAVMEALVSVEANEAGEAEPDWLDLQGYTAVEADGGHDRRRYDRRRRGGHRSGYGRGGHRRGGHADRWGTGRGTDGGVYGPRKDALRRAERFGLPSGGFVDMPGPNGAGGRIAAGALQASGVDPEEGASERTSDDAASVLTVTLGTAGQPGTQEAPGAGVGRSAASAPAGPSAMRLSFSKDAAPAQADEALATPLPASAFLFAGGMGLLGLSRRRAT